MKGTPDGGATYPAPPGFEWVYCASYWHKGANKRMVAAAYGYKAWCFLVRCRD